MSRKDRSVDNPYLTRINRRCFLKWSALLGGSAFVPGAPISTPEAPGNLKKSLSRYSPKEQMIRTGCPAQTGAISLTSSTVVAENELLTELTQ